MDGTEDTLIADAGRQTAAARRRQLVAGRFAIVRPLGQGGMGEVWLAHDRVLDRSVAIKTLRASSVPAHLRGSWLDMFMQEARSTAQLRHPGVLAVYDFGIDDGEPYLVLEFLRGQTLAERLVGGAVPPGRVLELATDLASALAHAHAHGVVHRDLKPANLFVETGGTLKVMDFGIALLNRRDAVGASVDAGSAPVTQGSMPRVAGTAPYMAPEQQRGDAQTGATDVWAYGLVVAQLLCGEYVAPDAAAARVPPVWRELVASCLQPRPEHRPDMDRGVPALLSRLDVTSAAAAVAVRPSLPTAPPPGPFTGRDADVERVALALQSGHHVVSLLGPAGAGKTVLGEHVAWHTRDRWDAVYPCDLSGARTCDEMLREVAAALDLAPGGGDPSGRIERALAARGTVLVVLDNMEQLVEHATVVDRWAAAAPEAAFLVTTQQRLGLRREHVIDVSTLALPSDTTPEAVRASPAIACLVAHVAEHGVELDIDRDAEALARLVNELDGLPLAIVLAAPRLRLMSPHVMCERLRKRFAILRSNARGTDPRHLTLRASLEAAWERLAPWEQTTLAQCSVFVGGFRLDAAEAVVDVGAHVDAPFVIDIIEALVERSLLQVEHRGEPGAEPRFRMLLSIAAFAAEQLAHDSGLQAAAERRHAECFAALGDAAAVERRGRIAGTRARAEIAADAANLARAVETAAQLGDVALCARLAHALSDVQATRIPVATSVELADRMPAPFPPSSGDEVWLGACRARLSFEQGAYDQAGAAFARLLPHAHLLDAPHRVVFLATWNSLRMERDEGSIALLPRLEQIADEAHRACHPWLAARARYAASIISFEDGDPQRARRHLDAVFELARSHDVGTVEARAWDELGIAAVSEGRPADAVEAFRASLRVLRRAGQPRTIPATNLANSLVRVGAYDEAAELAGTLITHAVRHGLPRIEQLALRSLCEARLEQGRFEEALDTAQRVVDLASESGSSVGLLLGHQYLGQTRSRAGDWKRAREAFATARSYGDRVRRVYLTDLLVATVEEACRHQQREAAIRTWTELVTLCGPEVAGVTNVERDRFELAERAMQAAGFAG